MKPVRLGISLCLACLIFIARSVAQPLATDSAVQQSAFNNVKTAFYAALGNDLPLYNGPQYEFYNRNIQGSAYFADNNTFSQGVIFYDGAGYSNIPLMYDLYADKVVTLLFNNFTKFSLTTGRVQQFNLLGHHFINIDADTLTNNTDLKTGFYDELYNGALQVLAKRSVSLQNTTGSNGEPETYFDPANNFFIKKGGIYYSVANQDVLLKILSDKKKEISQYIRDNDIKYRKDPESSLVKIAVFYDHLIK